VPTGRRERFHANATSASRKRRSQVVYLARLRRPPVGVEELAAFANPFSQETFIVRLKQTLAALTLVTAAGGALALAAPPIPRGDNCSGSVLTHHTLVYDGATAPNPTIRAAAATLYGPPTWDCGADQQTFNADVDFDNNGTYDACVTLYVAAHSGSCEGVHAMDAALNNFNVCGAGNVVVALSTLPGGLTANVIASDVSASLCATLPGVGPLARPGLFSGPTSTENRVFAIPFSLIVNKDFRNLLPASKVINPGVACPGGLADCPRIDISLSKDKLKGIYGNNDECDWRYMDPSIGAGPYTTPIIGAVMRNYLSGTRNNFNATMLETLGAGQGDLFEAGTGDVINRVNANDWCGNHPATCGEVPPVQGGGFSPCQSIPAPNHAISVGYVGTDRFNIVDPGTPANPFDDYGARKGTENYDTLSYNGHQFNKSSVQCGYYEYWSFERMYYDTAVHNTTLKLNLVKQFVNGVASFSTTDPTVVPIPSLQVSRANDGAPVFPIGPYNAAICAAP
jgi:hypothetical protein